MVADNEELERMDASELHARRLTAKEVLTPMKGEKIIFPVADGTVKLSGGDQVLRTSALIRDNPDRGEEQGNLLGESDGSSSTSFQDASLCDGEARNYFWSISGNFYLPSSRGPQSQTVHAERSIIPNPNVFFDVTRTTDTTLDVMSEKHIEDCWNVHGDRELSDAWTGFTRFTSLSEKPPD